MGLQELRLELHKHAGFAAIQGSRFWAEGCKICGGLSSLGCQAFEWFKGGPFVR